MALIFSGGGNENPALSSAQISSALKNILSSKLFAQSPRLGKFLKFVVERALETPGHGLSEALIAAEVFGKSRAFSPNMDATIRVTAKRVRTKLARYYRTAGRFESVVISLPHGYSPAFVARLVLPAAPSPHALLIGREPELDALHESLGDAMRANPHLLCVVAEPGVGKTALIERFLQEAKEHQDTLVGIGRCRLQLQTAHPYQPWLDLLSGFLANSSVAQDLLGKWAPRWLSLLQSSGTPNAVQRSALFGEIQRLFSNIGLDRPMALFFDDLHWADISTLDLLTQLLHTLGTSKILIVAAFRGSDMQIRQSAFCSVLTELKLKGLCRELPLPLLSQEIVKDYVDFQFPSHTFPACVVSELYQVSGGNALCVRDMIQHACLRKWILRKDGVWRFVERPSIWRTDLPQAVTAMAAKKLEELKERDRDVLWVSSLQGVAFDAAITAQAMGLEQDRVEKELDRLHRRHQLLRPTAQKLHESRGDCYEFAHILYFDSLRAMDRPGRRARYCERTAEALLAVYPSNQEVLAPVLARLFEETGRIADALPFHLSTARRALQLCGFRQALYLIEHGFGLLRQMDRSPEALRLELEFLALQNLALSSLHGFQYEPLHEIHRRAQALAEELRDEAASMRIGMAFWSFTSTQNFEKAIPIAATLRRRAEISKNHEFLANGGLAEGVSLLHSGNIRRAKLALDRAHQHCRPDGDRMLVPSAAVAPKIAILGNWARALWYSGETDEALTIVRQAFDSACQLEHPKSRAYAAMLLADIYHLRRDPEQTLVHAEEAIKAGMELELGNELILASGFRAWALAERGEPEECCRFAEKQLVEYGGPCRTKLLSHCASAYGRAGKPDRGLQILKEAFRSGQERRELYFDAELLRVQGELQLLGHADRSSRDRAFDCFANAVRVARSQGTVPFEVRALTSLLRLAIKHDGRRILAVASDLSRAISQCREGHDTPDLMEANDLLSRVGHRRRPRRWTGESKTTVA